MGLEDYDIIMTEESEDEQAEGSEELSLEDSIDGESFYNYTSSAKQKYGLKKKNYGYPNANLAPIKTKPNLP